MGQTASRLAQLGADGSLTSVASASIGGPA